MPNDIIRLPSDVGRCACLQIRKVSRRVTRLYDRTLEPSGLTCAQFSILANLAREELTVGDLAGRLVMDSTTLTRVLRPLERDGLVEVVPSREDRRRRVAMLTKRGGAALTTALPLWRSAQSELTKLLGSAEMKLLSGALDTVLQRISAEKAA